MSRVHFRWERRPSQPAAEALRHVVSTALGLLSISDSEIHVLITDDAKMRALNRQYRDRNQTTDVLSFPDGDRLPTGKVLLGQIVVSLDAAKRQAAELGHDELRELEELLLHGTLHLLGYDHEKDEGEMNRLENRVRKEFQR